MVSANNIGSICIDRSFIFPSSSNILLEPDFLPKSIQNFMHYKYNDRLLRASGRLMLGEHAVSIVSEFLHISYDVSEKFKPIWNLLYWHSILIDDIVDGNSLDTKQDLLVSQILLDKALVLISSSSVFFKQSIFEIFQRYRLESWVAMAQEQSWSCGEHVPNSLDAAILQQGRKSALAKFCSSALLIAEWDVELTKNQVVALDDLLSGIQILDDIADYLEDFSSRRHNIILDMMYSWLSSLSTVTPIDVKSLSESRLIFSLIASNAFCVAWKLAADRIDCALSALNAGVGNYYASYFRTLSTQSTHSSLQITSLVNNNRNVVNMIERNLYCDSKFQSIIDSQEASLIWSQMLHVIANGPKASN